MTLLCRSSTARRWLAVLAGVTLTTIATGGDPACSPVGLAGKAALAASGVESQEKTVWTGAYTEEQAARGEHIYGRRCRKCHRGDLTGDGAFQGDGSEVVPTLLGLSFELRWDALTVADMFLTISRAMPWDAPGSVSPQDNIDVISYLLKMNGFPPGDAELPTQIAQLEQIRITVQPPGG